MGILILLLVMAGPAQAQEKPAAPAQEKVAAQAQEKPATPAQEKASPVKAVPAQGQPPAKLIKRADGHYTANMDPSDADKFEVHIVQKGETLSAIARTTLENQKLWPQLWEANEHIVNPHWIYPNDRVLVHRLATATPPPLSAEGAVPEPGEPVPVAVANLPVPIPEAELPEATPPPPKPIQYPTLILSVPPPPPPSKPSFELKLTPTKPATEIKRADLFCSGFIRSEDVSDRLKVIGRFGSDPGVMATASEYVYLNLERDMKPGSTYQIVRPTRDVHKNSHNLGRHYLDIGQIRVVLLQNDFALARVVSGCEAVEVGDLVTPFRDVTVPELPRPRPFSPMMTSSCQNCGEVILAKTAVANFGSVYEASRKMAGVQEGHLQYLERGIDSTGGIIYVDLGRPSGVAPGDLYIVYRETPPDTKLYNLPKESHRLEHSRVAIAEIVIIRVEERASTALVTYSIDGIVPGDIIEKRAPLPRR